MGWGWGYEEGRGSTGESAVDEGKKAWVSSVDEDGVVGLGVSGAWKFELGRPAGGGGQESEGENEREERGRERLLNN